MTATCTITSATDPITSLNVTSVVAAGTCTAANTVTVLIVDESGTSIGPISATVVSTAWSIAATDVSTLIDGTLIYEATATDGSAKAFAARAADKNTLETLYISIAEFRSYIHDPSVLDTGPAANAISAACREVDGICGRSFYQSTSVRYFWPDSYYCCQIDDLATTTGLIVQTDTGYDGTYAQTLTINTHFVPEPRNQTQGGVTGWPYTELTSVLTSQWFPIRRYGFRETVKVTGTWGWAAVPDPVKQATFVIAAQLYKLGDAPFGNAGFGEFGVMRVREIPIVGQLLGPYSKTAGVVVA
jgi:hypothetical protein